MDWMHRPEQLAREFAFANSYLPTERGEHDIHVAHKCPYDVVGGKCSGRVPSDGTTAQFGDRAPHDEIDRRFDNHSNHVEIVRRPVLKLNLHRGLGQHPVQRYHRAPARILR